MNLYALAGGLIARWRPTLIVLLVVVAVLTEVFVPDNTDGVYYDRPCNDMYCPDARDYDRQAEATAIAEGRIP